MKSEQEMRYELYSDIYENPDSMLSFLETFRNYKDTDSYEYKCLEKIYNEIPPDLIKGVEDRDEECLKFMFFEKLSKRAALDMLSLGRYDRKTLEIMVNLDVDDYQLITHKIADMVKTVQKISIQNSKNTIPE